MHCGIKGIVWLGMRSLANANTPSITHESVPRSDWIKASPRKYGLWRQKRVLVSHTAGESEPVIVYGIARDSIIRAICLLSWSFMKVPYHMNFSLRDVWFSTIASSLKMTPLQSLLVADFTKLTDTLFVPLHDKKTSGCEYYMGSLHSVIWTQLSTLLAPCFSHTLPSVGGTKTILDGGV